MFRIFLSRRSNHILSLLRTVLLLLLIIGISIVVETGAFCCVVPHHDSSRGRRTRIVGLSPNGESKQDATTTLRWNNNNNNLLEYDDDLFETLPTCNDKETVVAIAAAPKPELTRRDAITSTIRSSFLVGSSFLVSGWTTKDAQAAATTTNYNKGLPFGVSDQVVSSLVFEKVLGKGSYKTVYLVSGSQEKDNSSTIQFALAVERLKGKSDVRDAIQGVRIAEQLERAMMQKFEQDDNTNRFERILGWWFQSSNVPEFVYGKPVFTSITDRERKVPKRFLGTKYLIALKPVYDMDLKKFAKKSPVLYPIGGGGGGSNDKIMNVVGGLPLSEDFALHLVREICHSGMLMHSIGMVHRDIKPKNIMLRNGRPVIIDFGFSDIMDNNNNNNNDVDKKKKNANEKICIVEAGRIKGEVGYVLAEDAALYRGCQEGDLYAMGKTLYEVLFVGSETEEDGSSGKQTITEAEAQYQNDKFRSLLANNGAATASRFRMSWETRNLLLSVISGLCREHQPTSFAEASRILMKKDNAMETIT